MIKVLVLGHNGMLGHMVAKFLRDKGINVYTMEKRWPLNQQGILTFNGDYIINCIGAIPQRSKSRCLYDINWQLPIWLDMHAPCKVIHPGTDCEGGNGLYDMSKNIAGTYIRTLGKQTKSIKTSIIGPELNSNASLLGWFLSKNTEVEGYTEAIWSGNTTLEWAKQCSGLMLQWDSFEIETILQSKHISKYELLNTIKKVFNMDIKIKPKKAGRNRSMVGHIKTSEIGQQLKELKEYYYDNNRAL
tara:strand:+ start:2164 stop:2898 length:735 start_codon:yes stop_codon:yes gene_type:complete